MDTWTTVCALLTWIGAAGVTAAYLRLGSRAVRQKDKMSFFLVVIGLLSMSWTMILFNHDNDFINAFAMIVLNAVLVYKLNRLTGDG